MSRQRDLRVTYPIRNQETGERRWPVLILSAETDLPKRPVDIPQAIDSQLVRHVPEGWSLDGAPEIKEL